ncbi:hypothetical protein DFA_07495 [Cavenderia fasciculata]|uniref:Uncharacterized protein n=1 Tax=Cavenderia fasciculata TaxID=261658 RepID=F4PWK7_CACFS|nr:uncharacterized protein DFA_07495 [Cavenderia fasciculata]EGG20371.1 hypothetical protein DFA_07495 [Cavenderia fasciculata]|eukprot:XP_004367354.1 hypothetical protein DFA_07495 [Cavenderia fasciculata]
MIDQFQERIMMILQSKQRIQGIRAKMVIIQYKSKPTSG